MKGLRVSPNSVPNVTPTNAPTLGKRKLPREPKKVDVVVDKPRVVKYYFNTTKIRFD